MKRTVLFSYLPTISILALAAMSGLQAQNTLSVSSSNVFLSGFSGGTAVQQMISVTSTPGTSIPFTAALDRSAGWLTLAPSGPNTPASITITANPAGLSPGVYDAIIVLSSPNASGQVYSLVVFTVNSPSPLTVSPTNLLFFFQQGGTVPAGQALTVNGPAFAVSANQPWLLVSGSGQTVSVQVNPLNLTPGTYYKGTITLTPTNGQNALLVPVILYVTGGSQVSASPTALTFNYQIGGTNNVTQKTINLTSPGATFNFTASAVISSGTLQWLSVNPTSGTTPANLTVTVIPTALPVGTYQGTVNIAVSGASTPNIAVGVTLNISNAPLLDLNTNSLNFTYQVGGSLPADQNVVPNSTTNGLAYQIAVSTNNTGNWLSIAVPNPTTPNPVTVSVNPVGLPAGTYMGTLTFSAVASNSPQVVNVTLTVSNNPTLVASPNSLVFNFQIGQNVPVPQQVSVTSSSGTLTFSPTITLTSTSNGVNWLTSSAPPSASTPFSFSVGVSPTGMSPGTYTGTITLATPGATNTITIPVTLNISNTALLNVSPSSLAFSAVTGSNPANAQTVTVTSTGEAVIYSVSVTQGSNFLSVGNPTGPASATFSSSFFVGVISQNLTTGVYKGTITLHQQNTNGNPDVTIPVTLTVTSGNLTITPATLNFTQAAGGGAPATQTVSVASTGSPLAFTAFASGANWLTVTPSSGTTPATLTVGVNAGSMQAGTYSGTINIVSTGAGNSPQTVTVNLTVGAAQNIVLSPASLSFSSQIGAPAPSSQTIAVTLSGGSQPFTAIATATGGGNWLSVSPASGTASTTATNLTVSVNPQGLTVGTYTGSISVASTGASNSPQTVTVSYTVAAIPTPAPTSVVNAGSNVPGPVSPGEIITIYGNNLGPTTAAVTKVSAAGFFDTTISDTQVTFDNIPAALWYVSATQINVIVPYLVAGRISTRMVVLYKNTPSAGLDLRVADAAPGIFVLNAAGQGAILNQNGTVNGASTPAQRGTVIVIYATGEGQTSPPGVDGKVIPADVNQLKKPLLPVTVTVGGRTAQVLYAGSAPGLISGALQVNALIPDDAPSGAAVPVVLNVGNISSQGTATVAIQ